jgi:large subunit ribosomal protein L21
MYAVVRTGGKQIRVQTGDVVAVELLGAQPGEQISLAEVLMLGGAGAAKIGTPLVKGAVVRATVQGETKGKKIDIFKYKRRKRYRLRKGHRQKYTQLRIDSIEG